jgi:hypothetical protein
MKNRIDFWPGYGILGAIMKKNDIKLGSYLTKRGKKGMLIFRFWHQNKEYLRSTGTPVVDVAREKAWAIYNEIVNPVENQKPTPLLRNTYATAGQCAELYKAGIFRRAKIGLDSVDRNVAKLAMLITEVLGLPGKDDWKEVRVNTLDENFVDKWRKMRYMAKGLPGEEFTDLWLNGTLNSTLAQVRSIFSKKAWKLYEKLKMPARDLILYAPNLEEPDYAFVEIPAHIDTRMQYLANAALCGLDEPEAPSQAVAVVYEMARFLGMTGQEITHARFDWIEEQADGSMLMVIKARPAIPAMVDASGKVIVSAVPAFTTKRNAKNRRLGVSKDRVERWRKAAISPVCLAKEAKKTRTAGAPGYIVPGFNHADREETVQREASEWVAGFLPDRTKTLHELRKQGGSEILKKYGLNAAADWLGDSIATAKKFYLVREVVAALGA